MQKRHLMLVFVLALGQISIAQLPKIKIPGSDKANQRITTERATSSTPSVVGVTGLCKNGGTRDIVIKVANIQPNAMNNVRVEAHPPFTVLASSVVNGEVHATVKGNPPSAAEAQYAQYSPGPGSCDLTIKFFKNSGDQYPAQELAASAKAEPYDAYLAQEEKQKQQMAEQQKQIDAAQAQMKKAQPALQEQQHDSVGDKWTVHWASGKSEVWTFSGFDPNMATMAVFKGPSGEVKIMFAGMFYQIMMGQCAMMAEPQGEGKVSGKSMGGTCSNSGAFTATVE